MCIQIQKQTSILNVYNVNSDKEQYIMNVYLTFLATPCKQYNRLDKVQTKQHTSLTNQFEMTAINSSTDVSATTCYPTSQSATFHKETDYNRTQKHMTKQTNTRRLNQLESLQLLSRSFQFKLDQNKIRIDIQNIKTTQSNSKG